MRPGRSYFDRSLYMLLPFHLCEIHVQFRGGDFGPTVTRPNRFQDRFATQEFDHVRKRMNPVHVKALDDGRFFSVLNWNNQGVAIATFGLKSDGENPFYRSKLT